MEGSRTEQEKPEWSVGLRKSQPIKWEALQKDYQIEEMDRGAQALVSPLCTVIDWRLPQKGGALAAIDPEGGAVQGDLLIALLAAQQASLC